MDGRKAITAFARTLLGSHYLWGSAGAITGVLNGARYRPGSVEWNRPSLQTHDLSICAAKCDVAGFYVCAGRFQSLKNSPVRDDDPHLVEFLHGCSERYANALLAQWECTGLSQTPRVVRGSNVDSAGKIVWGENCYKRRHFDCISFVNYVLTETAVVSSEKEGWHGGIENYAGAWTTDVPLADPAVAGDILIKYTEDEDSKGKQRNYHHIAFLDDDNPAHVIQAEQASTGVHADELYVTSRWQMRRRLGDRQIRHT